MKTKITILLLLGSISNAYSSEPEPTISDSVYLNTIVVTGTRTPRLLKDVPIMTRVITEREIKKVDATNIGELLQSELPGIEFSFSMNQQTALNMQGFGGNSVLFLQDGERLAGETLDNPDFSRLNLDNIQRIEIVKGAASSLYGSSAVGGVINIITKSSNKPWYANVNLRYSAYNEQRYGGTYGFSTKYINNTFNVQHTDIGAIHLNKAGQYNEVFANRTWNLKDKLLYTVNKYLRFTVRAGYFFRERDSQADSRERYRDFSGGLKGNYTHNRNDMEVAYSYDQYDKSNYIIKSRMDMRDYSNVQNTVRVLFNHNFNKNYILTTGCDFMRDYLMTYQFADNGNKMQVSFDGFGQLSLTPYKNFTFIAGTRYDYFSRGNANRFSTKLGFMCKLDKITVRGSYAGGFRAPTLKEMYMNFNMANIFMIYGNHELKPETSENLSASVDYRICQYDFNLMCFQNFISNRITTAWNKSLNGMMYTNMADMNIKGANAEVSARYRCGLSFRISYAYTYEHIKRGEPLVSATRPHTATTRIEYEKNWNRYGFNISLSGRYLSKVTADEYTSYSSYEMAGKTTYPAYSIWKLSFVQHVMNGIDIMTSADNLFNYVPSYYYNNSPVTKGRILSVGVSVDIDKFVR